MLLAWLLGCWDPTTTGPKGMVGTVVGPDGKPVAGVVVASLEAEKTTGADGRFAVQYKPPNTDVHFQRGPVFFQREMVPADVGGEVRIALPAERTVGLSCQERACDVTLTWVLGDGFTAMVATRCEPKQTVALTEIPVGTPSMSCRRELGSPEEAVEVSDRGDTLVAVPPAVEVPIGIRSTGSDPKACSVDVDGERVEPGGDGRWVARVHGVFTATASCDGHPARPHVGTPSEGPVDLAWSPEGPVVQPRPVFSPSNQLVLVADSGEGSGWRLTLVARPDGSFMLPPLSPGSYRALFAPSDAVDAAFAVTAPGPVDGALVVREFAPALFVGTLRLAQPVDGGLVPVRK